MKSYVALLIIIFSFNSYSKSFSVMSYNLENLFDTTHDDGKNDWTYLPLSYKNSSKEVQAYCSTVRNDFYRKNCFELDWNQNILEKKIQNLARVIMEYNNGQGADIIVFQEVENINALRKLISMGLKRRGYKYLSLIEGQDSRGIDVGIISRYPLISQKIHNLDLRPYSDRTTRGILEANFRIGKNVVAVFANHWPSQGNVHETRLIASQVLKKAALSSNADMVIAAGDFNTTKKDHPHGINKNILPHFEDVEKKGRAFSTVSAQGTHWYRGHWESLDKIFVLKRSLSKSGHRVKYNTFDIIYKSFMTKDLEWTDRDTGISQLSLGIPNRFNTQTGEGFSDHLPVAVEFEL